MTYRVMLHGVIVGRSTLEHGDAARGVARGKFRPALGYELVEPVFTLREAGGAADGAGDDAAALARYQAARDALGLELVGPDGTRISTAGIHVRAHREGLGPATYELEVTITDPAFWRDRGARADGARE